MVTVRSHGRAASFGRYIITADRRGEEVWRQNAEADDAGRLKFVLAISAIDPVTVRIRCESANGPDGLPAP